MNVNGEYRIPATRERVWEALHDPEVLRACIPGCEEVRRVSDTSYEGRLTAQVGAVTTAFTGTLTLGEARHPEHWTLTARVESAQAGWADGHATVDLDQNGAATLLAYRARIDPGGRLASVGGRLLHGVAIRMANDFFARLIERLRPHPLAAEPQELAEPISGTRPRRIVTPLAPTSAPAGTATPPVEAPPPPLPDEPTPARQNRVLIIGSALWAAIAACLFWPF